MERIIARVRELTGYQKLVVVVLFVIAAVMVLTTTLAAWPFAPYTVYSSEVIPDTVCPREDVVVEGDSEIDEGWYLTRLSIDSTWIPEDQSSTPESGGSGDILFPQPRERSSVASTVLREAPLDPGRYSLLTEATMYGTFSEENVFHGWGKTQTIEYGGDGVITVLPYTDERCEGVPEPQRTAGAERP